MPKQIGIESVFAFKLPRDSICLIYKNILEIGKDGSRVGGSVSYHLPEPNWKLKKKEQLK